MRDHTAKLGLIGAAVGVLVCNQVWAASCINPSASPQQISEFKLNPQSLIPVPTADARTVEAVTRDLAGTDPTLAVELVHVAATAKPIFQTAIAAGLAQAAVSCSTTDQQGSLQIQEAVAAFENGEFQASFAAVSGDLSTAAAQVAAASAEASVGSVVIVNPGVSSTSNQLGFLNGPRTSFSSVLITTSTPNVSQFGSSSVNQVSPTR
jgi:hypothetical protein